MNYSKNTVNYLNLWRGEFADNYRNQPRLYKALVENQVFFEDKEDCLSVTFYVKNGIQQHWIEVNQYDDFVGRLLILTGVKMIELNIVPEDDLPFA